MSIAQANPRAWLLMGTAPDQDTAAQTPMNVPYVRSVLYVIVSLFTDIYETSG